MDLGDILKSEEIIIFDNCMNRDNNFLSETYNANHLNKIDIRLLKDVLEEQIRLYDFYCQPHTFTVPEVIPEHKEFLKIVSEKMSFYERPIKRKTRRKEEKQIPPQYFYFKHIAVQLNYNQKKIIKSKYHVNNKDVLSFIKTQVNKLCEENPHITEASQTDRSLVATTIYIAEYENKKPALISRDGHIKQLIKDARNKTNFSNFKLYYAPQQQDHYELI